MKEYKITYTLIDYVEADNEEEASTKASETGDYGDLEDTCIEEYVEADNEAETLDVNNKISLPTETWVELYAELSAYVESKCYPNRETHDKNGSRLEETEDDFLDIVGDVEEILETFFIKEKDD